MANEFLSEKFCKHCGESETMCLYFYPYDNTIRRISRRIGINKIVENKSKNILTIQLYYVIIVKLN